MTDDQRTLTPTFESLSVPPTGEVLTVDGDGDFRSPEAPIVPVAPGTDNPVMTALRRILETATARMGRAIHWLPIPLGDEAANRYGETVPPDASDAIRAFRLGIIGRLLSTTTNTRTVGETIRDAVDLTTSVTRFTEVQRPPSSFHVSPHIDISVFRDVTGDDCGLNRRSTTNREEPAPIELAEIEALVDSAMEYALNRDRQELTIVHTSGDASARDRSFLGRVREYLTAEYADVILDELTCQTRHEEHYSDEMIVISERRLVDIRSELRTNPTRYDVLVTDAQTGHTVAEMVADVTGYPVIPEVFLGDGCVVAAPQLLPPTRNQNSIGTLTELLLASCTVCEYIGWRDVASSIREALAATIEDGLLRPERTARRDRDTAVDPASVADVVIDRLDRPGRQSGTNGVKTTPEERDTIKRIIAGMYTIVLDDELEPSEIELNQLFGDDEEAEIALPEVGINFKYWRRWPVERRVEVVLHELAHVEEGPDERDHGEEFYERFVDLTETAAMRQPAIETLFGAPIEFTRVRRYIIESVHEETIEPDLEWPVDRQRKLRGQFDVASSNHY